MLPTVQKHGQETAYAFMVDADFAVNGTWRLRLAAQRMQRECAHRCSCTSDIVPHGICSLYAIQLVLLQVRAQGSQHMLGQWCFLISLYLARRSIPACAKALQIRIHSGTTVFFTTRVFPTAQLGTEDGWQYYYPVHEVGHCILRCFNRGRRQLRCRTADSRGTPCILVDLSWEGPRA